MPEQMIRIPRSIGPLKIRPPSSHEQEGRPTQHLGNSPVESVYEKDMTLELLTYSLILCLFSSLQMEIAKRLNGIIAQLLPFLSQEV